MNYFLIQLELLIVNKIKLNLKTNQKWTAHLILWGWLYQFYYFKFKCDKIKINNYSW